MRRTAAIREPPSDARQLQAMYSHPKAVAVGVCVLGGVGITLAEGGGDAGAPQRRQAVDAEVDLVQQIVRGLPAGHQASPNRLASPLWHPLRPTTGTQSAVTWHL